MPECLAPEPTVAAATEPEVSRTGGLRPSGAVVLAVLVGFLAGLVLFLPWDALWGAALTRMARRMEGARLSWQSVDRAGPLNFRINGLSLESPGSPFSPRVQTLEVRLGFSPFLSLKADTGGRSLKLVLLDTGAFDLDGEVNLAALGRRDIKGAVLLRGGGSFLQGRDELEKGFVDIRARSVSLPDGLWLGEATLDLDYRDGLLRIRSFTMREPVQLRAEGSAVPRLGDILRSSYSVAGEMLRAHETIPFSSQGQLGDFLGAAALAQ